MKWSPNLFFIGFFFIILGALLLLFASGSIDNGFFFIFPFFFFSGTGSFNAVLLVGIGLFLFFAMLCMIPRIFSQTDFNTRRQSDFMIVGTHCAYCGNLVPENAAYCPTCGHTIDQERPSDETL